MTDHTRCSATFYETPWPTEGPAVRFLPRFHNHSSQVGTLSSATGGRSHSRADLPQGQGAVSKGLLSGELELVSKRIPLSHIDIGVHDCPFGRSVNLASGGRRVGQRELEVHEWFTLLQLVRCQLEADLLVESDGVRLCVDDDELAP